jgi:predicted glycosyltransferase
MTTVRKRGEETSLMRSYAYPAHTIGPRNKRKYTDTLKENYERNMILFTLKHASALQVDY